MKKQELIQYFNSIRPYINLTELCKAYNRVHEENGIDYNNLRHTLNGTAPHRISEDKLVAFYDFVVKDIFEDVFRINGNALRSSDIHDIIQTKTTEMISLISEALEHGFSNQ